MPLYREVWKYAKQQENVFVDLSNPVYVDEGVLPAVVEELGAEKCIYGTDGPYAYTCQAQMLQRIQSLRLSDSEKEQIL